MKATLTHQLRRLLAAGILFTLCSPPWAGVVFSEDFNGYNGGNQNALQYQSGLKVSHSGNLPLWNKGGAGVVHAVDKDGAGDYAPMIWQDNVITLASGIAANDSGTTYYEEFSAGAAVYAAGAAIHDMLTILRRRAPGLHILLGRSGCRATAPPGRSPPQSPISTAMGEPMC